MINMRYCESHEWFGGIRGEWASGDIKPVMMSSDKELTTDFQVCIWDNKEAAKQRHLCILDDLFQTNDNVLYTDGSRQKDGCAVAYIVYERGLTEGAKGFAVPGTWNIVICELFAIYLGLKELAEAGVSNVYVYWDCVPALRLIDNMRPDGDMAGIWDCLVPIISLFDKIWFEWVPADSAITGNEMADIKGKQSVGSRLHEYLWNDINMGLSQEADARRLRKEEWVAWHKEQGHSYYKRNPTKAKHLKGLTRLDSYILFRLRIGKGADHDQCPDGKHELHLSRCQKYLRGRPALHTLFDDKHLPLWIDWWRLHENLPLGIPREYEENEGIVTVCGNPFNGTVTTLVNGILQIMYIKKKCTWCLRIGCNGGGDCVLPTTILANVYYWVNASKGVCPGCDRSIVGHSYSVHFTRHPECREMTFDLFWAKTWMDWPNILDDFRRAIVIAETMCKQMDSSCRCGTVFSRSALMRRHLRNRAGAKCYESFYDRVMEWAERRFG